MKRSKKLQHLSYKPRVCVDIYEFTLSDKRWLCKEDFYYLIDENKMDLCMSGGEEIIYSYKTFLDWLSQNKFSFEELLVKKRDEIQCYFTNTGIYGLIHLAEYWLSKSRKYAKTHKALLYANCRIYNKGNQSLKAYSF